jgi:hypothetical protein
MGEANPFLRDSDLQKESEEPLEKTSKRGRVARFLMRSFFGERDDMSSETKKSIDVSPEIKDTAVKDDTLPVGRFKRLWQRLFPVIASKDVIEKRNTLPATTTPFSDAETSAPLEAPELKEHILSPEIDKTADFKTATANEVAIDVQEGPLATTSEQVTETETETNIDRVISYERQFLPPIELIRKDATPFGSGQFEKQHRETMHSNVIHRSVEESVRIETEKNRVDTKAEMKKIKKEQKNLTRKLKQLTTRVKTNESKKPKNDATKTTVIEAVPKKSLEIKVPRLRRNLFIRNKQMKEEKAAISSPEVIQIKPSEVAPEISLPIEQVISPTITRQIEQVTPKEFSKNSELGSTFEVKIADGTSAERHDELVYEKRHEIKKEQFQNSAAQKGKLQKGDTGGQWANGTLAGSAKSTTAKKDDDAKIHKSLYGKAATNGVWAAVIVVLFALLAYYLSK